VVVTRHGGVAPGLDAADLERAIGVRDVAQPLLGRARKQDGLVGPGDPVKGNADADHGVVVFVEDLARELGFFGQPQLDPFGSFVVHLDAYAAGGAARGSCLEQEVARFDRPELEGPVRSNLRGREGAPHRGHRR